LIFGFLIAAVLVGSIGVPIPANAQGVSVISEATEKSIGRRMDPLILKKMGYYGDPFLQRYVNRIGQRVAKVADRRAITYRFKVVDEYRENAMALPGGYIYITRGMLASLNSEAELAGVLGHEVAHVTQRHGARQMTKALGAQFLTLAAAAGGAIAGGGAVAPAITLTQAVTANIIQGHGKEFEFEADEKGLFYAWKAGYDPREAAKFMRRLRQLERLRGIGYHGFGATHPETTMRLLKLDEIASVLVRPGQKLEVDADRFKAQLSGLVYGERKDRMRLRIYTARGNENLQDVAKDLLGDPNYALELSLMNDQKEATPLKPGQKLKVLVKQKSAQDPVLGPRQRGPKKRN
jgi:predicted Zn-dependent protease